MPSPDQPLRVLLVEDREADAELIAREVRRGYPECVTLRVYRNVDLLPALTSFNPHLVLSDHALPGFSGYDALRIVRQHRPDLPVIVVTGSLDEETAVEYIQAGATDYVVKNRPHRLGPAVQRALALVEAQGDAAQAEAARLRSEQRFRKLVEFSSDVITLLDAQGFILYSTQSLKPTLGYAAGEMVGHSVFELVHPADLTGCAQLVQDLVESPDQELRTCLRVRHKDGSWRELDAVAANHLGDPVVGAIVVAYHDVTDRRRAEEALRESEERFRQMAEHIREAFFVMDLATARPLYVSPTWAEIWGRSLEQGYDPRIWFDAVHTDDQALVQADLEAIKRGDASNSTFRVVRPDGGIRWVRGRAFPVRDEAGDVYRMVGVSEDITELRGAEERFVQSQKMEAIGRLAGGVAHDFNNLLTVILGETEHLLTDLPAGVAAESLDEIMKAGKRAAGLTRQLLAFSRRQLVQPVVFDLNETVTEMSTMLRRLIGEDVTLVTRLAPEQATVLADRGQMEQVITNLAVNARDAMPHGGTLTLETAVVILDQRTAVARPDATPGRYVVLAIGDTGTGMTDDVKERLFEPFFTTKERGKGTGLGLATCYGIVKDAGGHMVVLTELGAGTVMQAYLSLVAPAGTVRSVESQLLPRGAESILLVEDEVAVRRVASRMLQMQGYQVLEAGDAEAAMAIVTSHTGAIELLLTDVVLPGLGGRELAEEVRRLRPTIKVLFASGYTDDVTLHHRLLDRSMALVEKPFTRETLSQRVREALDS